MTDYAKLRSYLSKKNCKTDIHSNKILTQLNTTHEANLYKTSLKKQNYNNFHMAMNLKKVKLSYFIKNKKKNLGLFMNINFHICQAF